MQSLIYVRRSVFITSLIILIAVGIVIIYIGIEKNSPGLIILGAYPVCVSVLGLIRNKSKK